MASLAEIRAKLKAAEQRASGNANTGSGELYPFWNLQDGGETVIRFLPDGNDSNTFFWVEKAMIKLPFAGVKGDAQSKEVIVQVPCMEMYGETCPILSEVRPWFKDPELEELGRKYWKKRTYIFQGLVVDDGLAEKEKPENPVRRFAITAQLYKLICAALNDPELDDLPTDYINGLDFRIKKGTNGKFADYAASTWSRRTRPLSEAEQAAIKQYGLPDLATALPKKPTEAELAVIKEMFEASIDGEPYDPERWGAYYKPYGLEVKAQPKAAQAPAAQKPAPKAAPFVADDDFESDVVAAEDSVASKTAQAEPAESVGSPKAQAILDMIRNRQKQ